MRSLGAVTRSEVINHILITCCSGFQLLLAVTWDQGALKMIVCSRPKSVVNLFVLYKKCPWCSVSPISLELSQRHVSRRVSHPHRHNTDTQPYRQAGMPPDRMTPDTDQHHNRRAESSVNGTIVLLGNKAGPEHRRAAHQPALVMGFNAVHRTA